MDYTENKDLSSRVDNKGVLGGGFAPPDKMNVGTNTPCLYKHSILQLSKAYQASKNFDSASTQQKRVLSTPIIDKPFRSCLSFFNHLDEGLWLL